MNKDKGPISNSPLLSLVQQSNNNCYRSSYRDKCHGQYVGTIDREVEKPPQFTELEQTIKYKYKNVTLVFSIRSSPDDANIVGETHVECFGGVWRSFFQFCIFTPKLPTKLQYNFLIFLSFICFTGRNPHRWVCRLERVDNVYRFD